MKLKILSFVIAVAAGSSVAILVSKMLGIDAVVPGVIGSITGAVVVILTTSPSEKP